MHTDRPWTGVHMCICTCIEIDSQTDSRHPHNHVFFLPVVACNESFSHVTEEATSEAAALQHRTFGYWTKAFQSDSGALCEYDGVGP